MASLFNTGKSNTPLTQLTRHFDREQLPREYVPENVASSSSSRRANPEEQFFQQKPDQRRVIYEPPSAQLPPLNTFVIPKASSQWVNEFQQQPSSQWVDEFQQEIIQARNKVLQLMSEQTSKFYELQKQLNMADYTPEQEADLMIDLAKTYSTVEDFYIRGIRPPLSYIAERLGNNDLLIKYINIYPPDFDLYQRLLDTTNSSPLAERLLKMVHPRDPQRLLSIVTSKYWRKVLSGMPITESEAFNERDAVYLSEQEMDPEFIYTLIKQKQYDVVNAYYEHFPEIRKRILHMLITNFAPFEEIRALASIDPEPFTKENGESPDADTIMLLKEYNPDYKVYNDLVINNKQAIRELVSRGYPVDNVHQAIDSNNLPVLIELLKVYSGKIPYQYAVRRGYMPIIEYLFTNFPISYPKGMLSFTDNEIIKSYLNSLPSSLGKDPILSSLESNASNEVIINFLNKGYPVTYDSVLASVKLNGTVLPILLSNIILSPEQQVEVLTKAEPEAYQDLFNRGVRPPLELVYNMLGPKINWRLLSLYPKDMDFYYKLASETNNTALLKYLYRCGVDPAIIKKPVPRAYWRKRISQPNEITLDEALNEGDGAMVEKLLNQVNLNNLSKLYSVVTVLTDTKMYDALLELLSKLDLETILQLDVSRLLDSDPYVVMNLLSKFAIPEGYIVFPHNFESINYITELYPNSENYVLEDEDILYDTELVAKLIQAGYPVTIDSLIEAITTYNNDALKLLLKNYNSPLPYDTAVEANNVPALKSMLGIKPVDIDPLLSIARDVDKPDIIDYLTNYKSANLAKNSKRFMQLYQQYQKQPNKQTSKQLTDFLSTVNKLMVPIHADFKLPPQAQKLFDKITKQYSSSRL
jgi:hypothetical protein